MLYILRKSTEVLPNYQDALQTLDNWQVPGSKRRRRLRLPDWWWL